MKHRILALVALGIAALSPAAGAAPGQDDHPVIELRQYKIMPGQRDAFTALFESRFVESQEVLGMRLVGQFHDRADPSRFTWIRGFRSMAERGKALDDFYFGPVWQANRDAANPMLDDNDNVLLLQPAWPGSEFAPPSGVRPAPGAPAAPAGLVVATIEYLWKEPADYAAWFRDHLAPACRAAGLPVIAAYIPETQENNFPRLHVRQGERVFVWFTRASSPAAYAAASRKLAASREWRAAGPAQRNYRERAPQRLMLDPTPRSLLR